MPEYRDNDETRVVEIDAVLEHLRQVKEDTVKMIVSLQKERDLKKPKSTKGSQEVRPSRRERQDVGLCQK